MKKITPPPFVRGPATQNGARALGTFTTSTAGLTMQ